VGRPPTLAEGVSHVEVDLRARPAGTGVAHHPEVVLAHALDTVGRKPDGVEPQLGPFVVALVHGDPQAVGIDAQHRGEQLPRQGDGTRLEVLAETEVAQHLEERQVSPGDADIGDVVVLAPDPDALLHRGGQTRSRGLLAQDVGQELVHPCVGEQRGGPMMGDEPRGRDANVVPLGKESGEGAAQLVGSHGRRPAYRPHP